jgi:hypothetical protein
MADPDSASELQRALDCRLRAYNASMVDYVSDKLPPTCTGRERSVGLKKFAQFYPDIESGDDFALKLPLYKRNLRLALVSSSTRHPNVYSSDSDSSAEKLACDDDGDGADEESDARGNDTDRSAGPCDLLAKQSVPAAAAAFGPEEEQASPPDANESAHDDDGGTMANDVRGNDVRAEQSAPAAASALDLKEDEEEEIGLEDLEEDVEEEEGLEEEESAPPGDAVEEAVLAVALSHSIVGTANVRRSVGPEDERHLEESAKCCRDSMVAQSMQTTIFGSGSDDEEEISDVAPTLFEDCPIKVFSPVFPFAYTVYGVGDYEKTTGCVILEKIRRIDDSFVPGNFDLGYHPGSSPIVSFFDITLSISLYDFHDATTQVLSLFLKDPTASAAVKPSSKRRQLRRKKAKAKTQHRCKIVKCPGHADLAGHLPCSNEGCVKLVTIECYLGLAATHNLDVVEGSCFCTKTCYVSSHKSKSQLQRAWDKDGKEGRDDPNNSMSFLVAWLIVPGNYDKWRGGRENCGRTKKAIANEIAVHIASQGVLCVVR